MFLHTVKIVQFFLELYNIMKHSKQSKSNQIQVITETTYGLRKIKSGLKNEEDIR